MPRKVGTPYRIDISGNKYGYWLVLYRSNGARWLCKCVCGKEKIVQGSSLKLGVTKSCGCMKLNRTHGMEGTPTYNSWAHMLTRCRNEKHKQYPQYGGRGIKVCERWLSFENFYEDMGEKPEGMSIDRIDNEGDYRKDNCRWASQKTQVRNRRNSPTYEWNGEKKSLAELAEMHGLKWRRVYERIRNGWTLERALSKSGRVT